MPKVNLVSDDRIAGTIKLPRFKPKIFEKDTLCFGCLLYNQLPVEIRGINNLPAFRMHTK